MKEQTTTSVCEDQPVVQGRETFCEAMATEGFAPSTQRVYARAFDGFCARRKGCSLSEASVQEARDYLAELKRTGASDSRRRNPSAALRFFFTKVRKIDAQPVSPLRRRMIEDMQLHRFAQSTQRSYLRAVQGLAQHFGRRPDQITEEEIRAYFVHLTSTRKLARPTVTSAMCGIKFFYETTLKRDWSLTGVPMPRREKKLPVVLTRKEVHRILSRIEVLRYRACLSLIYACGLRLAEGCRIELTDIDRARGLLHVRGGKGAKDRYVPLPASILPLLEAAWRSHRHPRWLFPSLGQGAPQGRHSERPVPRGTVQQAFRKAHQASGVSKKVSVHSLRHAYATHLLEAKVDLRQIQQWLGHNSPSVTAVYAHVSEENTQSSTRVLESLMDDLK